MCVCACAQVLKRLVHGSGEIDQWLIAQLLRAYGQEARMNAFENLGIKERCEPPGREGGGPQAEAGGYQPMGAAGPPNV